MHVVKVTMIFLPWVTSRNVPVTTSDVDGVAQRVPLRHPVLLPHLIVLERRLEQRRPVPPAARVNIIQKVRSPWINNVVGDDHRPIPDQTRRLHQLQVRKVTLLAVVHEDHVRHASVPDTCLHVTHTFRPRALQDLDHVAEPRVVNELSRHKRVPGFELDAGQTAVWWQVRRGPYGTVP